MSKKLPYEGGMKFEGETHNYFSLVKGFVKWALIAMLVGAIVGLAGVAFHHALSFATEFRTENRVIIFTMPIAGVLIVSIYKLLGMSNDPGTNCIIKGARGEEKVSLKLAPLIFAATFLTHISGGSAGREGAALQIGGSLASPVGKVLKLDKEDTATLIMCGMAAGFSALFGTPIAAAVFAVEVVIVASAQYAAISENPNEPFELRYVGPLAQAENAYQEMLRGLSRSRREDMQRMYTTFGPHRDDVALMLFSHDLRAFGSQGQLRTAVLSMKLGEIRLIEEEMDEPPTLLLDDVLSELDLERQEYLIKTLSFNQLFITTAEMQQKLMEEFPDAAIFRVVKGKVEK